MHKESGNSALVIVGTVLSGLVALGIIMTWKIDSVVGTQAQALRKENVETYVNKEVYTLQIKVLNENIRSIARAVGVRNVK